MKRPEQREWAVKLAYQTEAAAMSDEALEQLLFNHEIEDTSGYIRLSLKSIMTHREAIDAAIKRHLSGWSFERLMRIDLAILRVAVNEMCCTRTAPVSVVINEAVEMAKRYSNEDSYRFINGVLSSISKTPEPVATDGEK
ncbi:MAG: transcription antitermination factor NusB [Ndongobacter sp.]|nr:transcription antitermination factor NusB [Ndongobacter sp.]